MKRKQLELMKSDLGVQLTKLTVDSGNLNSDMHEAKVDFELMFKSIADRQADILTKSLFLEEKYGDTIAVLDGKPPNDEGESSVPSVVLPTNYNENIRTYVDDSAGSLYNHGVFRAEEIEEMEGMFKKYQALWETRIKDLKERCLGIEKERDKLDRRLTNFKQVLFLSQIDSEDEEEEAESEDDSE